MARILAAAFALTLLMASSIAAPAWAGEVRDIARVQQKIAYERELIAGYKEDMVKAQAACDSQAFSRAENDWWYQVDGATRDLQAMTPAGPQAAEIKALIDNELIFLVTGAGGHITWKRCEPSIVHSIPDPEPVKKPVVEAPLPDGVVRPVLAPVEDPKPPASFCSQVEKVNFLNTVYNPAAATALSNSQKAQVYSGQLNGFFVMYMRNEGGPIWRAIQTEMAVYTPIAAGAYAQSMRINAMYDAIMAVPIVPCAQPAENEAVAVPGQPLTPVEDKKPATPGKPDCPPEGRRKSIVVGPNGKAGSGARLKAKAASTAMGIAGGLLGGALPGGGGGGGGGSSGPPTVVCKIKDGEMTVFNDPATGISLKIGAKRAGGTVVVFSEIAKSPDNGTFQTAFLENPQGEAMAPADVGICDLWGEWKLTVSWTKTTYVDGQVVKRESGGWQKAGRFSVPGVLSSAERPDGLWKQLGFSNASHGARKIAAQYRLPAGGGPVDAVIHVTRPSGDPVTTVPFALRMVEGPNGFTFTKAPEIPCPPEATQVRTDPVPAPPVVASNPPPPSATQVRELTPVEDLYTLERDIDTDAGIDRAIRRRLSRPQCTQIERSDWGSDRDEWVWHMQRRLAKWRGMKPAGPLADGVREALAAETARLEEDIKNAKAMTLPSCRKEGQPPPAAEEPDGTPSILESIPEVPVIS
jgi:hypothetical protein